MFFKNKIIVRVFLLLVAIAIGLFGKLYVYDYKINHNFDTVTEGKVYKSGVLPPDEIADYVAKYKIKSILDLRYPGTGDDVNNPEIPAELKAEKLAAAKIKGLNHFNIGSEQVPKTENLKAFFKVMDDPANYPVLIHCFHGVGRAEIYSAIYRIEYENWDRDQARTSTRLVTKYCAFDLGKPKGDFLHTYVKRNEKAGK
ncbi:dual specificity protein phosphatase family protein [Flavobacterium difficile]|uniref:Dual specificity protein phosphatase family protein n=1 Tax=Flavobacterium difficile TaxID=2709659 RepID=A0ABX0I9X0_9FLAO|nr:dual specificity protein phosphatase family protein [Flavobacterium difficile]NHM02487.1 dual specificity protein phosphatase family protein [Flavobacterium difficile]